MTPESEALLRDAAQLQREIREHLTALGINPTEIDAITPPARSNPEDNA